MEYQIPGVEILGVVGTGAHGTVFLVEHAGVRACAKVMTAVGNEAFERFSNEVRLLTERRGDEHAVQILSADLAHHPPYYTMEHCELGSLRGWVECRRPWQEVAWAMAAVLEVVAPLHERGGFHRDLKPDNILWASRDERRVVKLADFGIARDGLEDETMTRSDIGTTAYMPPEVFAGGPYSPAADIYALGVTMLELLAGSKELGALAHAPGPPELKAVVAGMLVNAPEARPAAGELRMTLEALVPEGSQEGFWRDRSGPVTETRPQEEQAIDEDQHDARVQDAFAAFAEPVSDSREPPHDESPPAATPTPTSGVLGAIAAVALPVAAGVALATLANTNSWDPNLKRYRNSKGQLKSGRFDR